MAKAFRFRREISFETFSEIFYADSLEEAIEMINSGDVDWERGEEEVIKDDYQSVDIEELISDEIIDSEDDDDGIINALLDADAIEHNLL